ncbi:NUDIX hydrolase [Kitasatospora sp. NPDC048540]|uniref:NUDIX hydrolase n=1 Tax=Kitasatospora sp. NPDC048540 TaxID=3155634 RepID=UPI0033FAB5EC
MTTSQPADGDGRDLLAAAGVLFTDERGRLLVVRVSYAAEHPVEIPGGGWEDADGSPRETARREIEEELGITPRLGPLACLDWSLDGDRPPIAAFLYWADPLTAAQLAAVRLEERELGWYGYLAPELAASALPPLLSRRVTACLRAPRSAGPLELEVGHPAGHTRAHLAPAPPAAYTGAAALPGPGAAPRPAPAPPMDRETYLATRPRIRAKARMLFTDPEGRILLVRLRPRAGDLGPYWVLPGGSVEADRELPRQAARREIREELGWECEVGRLLALDWVPAEADRPGDRARLVHVYDGGTLAAGRLATARLQPAELAEARMFTPDGAREVLPGPSWARIAGALAARDGDGGPAELVQGVPAAP